MKLRPDHEFLRCIRSARVMLIPLFTFVGTTLVAYRLGLWEIQIQPESYQLLDVLELKNHSFNSLLYLHSQPPGLNALFAVILNLSDLTGIPEKVLVKSLYLSGGFVGTLLLFNVIHRVSSSTALATLGVLAVLSDPAYHFYSTLFFYSFILHFLFLILIWLIAIYLTSETDASLFLMVPLIALITNIRTLFHPIWAFGIYMIVILSKTWISGRRNRKQLQRFGLVFFLLLLLLSVWPLKNYLLFGQFTYSSWDGFNLSRETPVNNPVLGKYLSGDTDAVSEEVEAYLETFRPFFKSESLKVILAPRKIDGSLNWNHIIFLMTNRDLTKRSLEWRLNNLRSYLKRTVFYYFIWTRPSYIHPYTGIIRGPKTEGYRRYSETYRRLIDVNVRPFVEMLAPNLFLHQMAYVLGIPIEYTLYGVVFFPLLLVFSTAFILFNLKQKRPQEGIVLASLFCHVFPLVITCLTDGLEGNRMSFPTSPLLIIATAYVIHESIKATHALIGRTQAVCCNCRDPNSDL